MLSIIKNSIFKQKAQNIIVIVSGLPRSGTSMMMSMLEAGGIEIVKDEIRKADQDNPKGYYEFEKVKEIAENNSWLDECYGKAVKIVANLIFNLPNKKKYMIIFMNRKLKEVLDSQSAMLKRLNRKGSSKSNEEMAVLYEDLLKKVYKWIENKNIDTLYISYNDVVENPRKNADMVKQFLKKKLDVERMVQVVDQRLYRRKSSNA